MKRHLRSLAIATFALIGVAAAAAPAWSDPVGPPGGRIYAHDNLYQTVGTPTVLPPVGKFDTIYVLGGTYINVAEVAPGDQAFNGGRWEVRPIVWTGMGAMQFTNAEQIHAAVQAGQITIGEVVKRFECPLIPVRNGH